MVNNIWNMTVRCILSQIVLFSLAYVMIAERHSHAYLKIINKFTFAEHAAAVNIVSAGFAQSTNDWNSELCWNYNSLLPFHCHSYGPSCGFCIATRQQSFILNY